ncbi:2694_t:CDS:1, partial [Paraglomus brasilianum]
RYKIGLPKAGIMQERQIAVSLIDSVVSIVPDTQDVASGIQNLPIPLDFQ